MHPQQNFITAAQTLDTVGILPTKKFIRDMTTYHICLKGKDSKHSSLLPTAWIFPSEATNTLCQNNYTLQTYHYYIQNIDTILTQASITEISQKLHQAFSQLVLDISDGAYIYAKPMATTMSYSDVLYYVRKDEYEFYKYRQCQTIKYFHESLTKRPFSGPNHRIPFNQGPNAINLLNTQLPYVSLEPNELARASFLQIKSGRAAHDFLILTSIAKIRAYIYNLKNGENTPPMLSTTCLDYIMWLTYQSSPQTDALISNWVPATAVFFMKWHKACKVTMAYLNEKFPQGDFPAVKELINHHLSYQTFHEIAQPYNINWTKITQALGNDYEPTTKSYDELFADAIKYKAIANA